MIAQFYFFSLHSSGTVFITMATSVRHPIEPAEMILLHKHRNKLNRTLSQLKDPYRFMLKFISRRHLNRSFL